ncbi:MAG: FkbM family methyltransferase [Gemmataceae bacterium]|nr:FkbM family methyltransferase [Gemmataceae bacterium]
MKLPAPSYRVLFFVSVGLTAVTVLSSTVYTRRVDAAARRANEELNDLNPLSISAYRLRDKEFTFVVDNYGFKYQGTTGNLIDDTVLTHGTWEKDILFFLEDYARAHDLKDTTFVDVGANTGVYSLFMATRVKQVHAIEPFPPVLKKLHANVKLNGFANLTVHEVGYGENEATLPFYQPEEVNLGAGSFRPDGGQTAMHLKIVSGDTHLCGLTTPPVSMMKIDIEGYEEAALKGLRRTLETHRPLLMLEVTTPNHNGTIGSFDQLKALLPADYEFYMMVSCPRHMLNGHYELKEFGPLAANFFATDLHKNIIVVPAEKSAKMPRRNW